MFYCTRIYLKKHLGKAITIALIFFIALTLIFSGLIISSSVKASKEALLSKIDSSVVLKVDRQKVMNAAKNSTTGRPDFKSIRTAMNNGITIDQANKIAGEQNVVSYNFITRGSVDSPSLTPFSSTDTTADDNTNAKSKRGGPMAQKEFSLLGLVNSSTYSSFSGSSSTESLTSGRALTKSDSGTNNALVSNVVAEQNSLNLGSTFTITDSNNVTQTATVVGIFTTSATANAGGPGMSDPYNTIYMNYSSVNKITGGTALQEAVFNLNSPTQMESFISTVKSKNVYDPNTLTLTYGDNTYKTMKSSFAELESIGSIITYGTFIAASIILMLILSLFIKGRRLEIGTYLALGRKKSNIIGQIFAEVFLLGLTGIIFVILIGNALAQVIISSVGVSSSSPPRSGSFGYSMATNAVSSASKISSSGITSETLLMLFAALLIIVIIGVLIPTVNIIRLKPKTILSMYD